MSYINMRKLRIIFKIPKYYFYSKLTLKCKVQSSTTSKHSLMLYSRTSSMTTPNCKCSEMGIIFDKKVFLIRWSCFKRATPIGFR